MSNRQILSLLKFDIQSFDRHRWVRSTSIAGDQKRCNEYLVWVSFYASWDFCIDSKLEHLKKNLIKRNFWVCIKIWKLMHRNSRHSLANILCLRDGKSAVPRNINIKIALLFHISIQIFDKSLEIVRNTQNDSCDVLNCWRYSIKSTKCLWFFAISPDFNDYCHSVRISKQYEYQRSSYAFRPSI